VERSDFAHESTWRKKINTIRQIVKHSVFAGSLLCVCTFIAGCAEAEPIAGRDTAFSSVCDKANEDQSITVTGFLRFPESFSGTVSVVLRLYETNAYAGEPIGVTMKFGTRVNRVDEVSDQYVDEDLLIYLADGGRAGFGTQV
jgi:hypothetical protein